MKPGDHAGLVALQSGFGTIGVQKAETGEAAITMCVNGGQGEEKEIVSVPLDAAVVDLRIHFNFKDSADIATFWYSVDGSEWQALGEKLEMRYTLDHFMGYRIGLFQYATAATGGSADFDYFRYSKLLGE
jgi:beta-xylosidase